MKVNEKIIKIMVMGHIGIRMVLGMLESEKMMCKMERVRKFGLMERSIKEGIKKGKKRDRDNLNG